MATGLPGLLGPKLLRGGQEIDTASVCSGTVALYFSAHWCPPCRSFTPLFSKVYKRSKEQGKSFEVVFISSDHDESSFQEYYGTMPWLALPFHNSAQRQSLGTAFGIRGIPAVVLVSGGGSLIDRSANAKVMSPGFLASLPRVLDVEGDVGPLPAEPVPVRIRHRGRVVEVEVDPDDDWEILRMQVFSATEVPVEQQRLFGLGAPRGPLREDVALARALAVGLRAQRGSGLVVAGVPESARSASSTQKAWSAKQDDKEPWYQMDLGAARSVAGVVVAPRAGNPVQWVTKFKVSVATAETGPWQPAGEEFAGCVSEVGSCRAVFPAAMEARFVRVHPTEYKTREKHCSLRADVLLAGDAPDLPPEIVVLGNFSQGDPFEVAGEAANASALDTSAKMMEEQHLAMLQAKLSALPQRLQALANTFQRTLKYDDLDLQRQALDQIPVCALDALATASEGACSPESGGYEIAFMRQLLRWFKHCFFSWTNAPRCDNCGGATKAVGRAEPTQIEKSFGAGTVEVYQGPCGQHTRFPRYNDPGKLLETRTGRCGEWANCFTLVCRALGYEARWVQDWTDHVWTEIYSDSWGRWVHADSCEAAVDCALMYEKGWGKKLTYCVSFARDNVRDVSRRYTRNYEAMLARRGEFREQELSRALTAVDEFAAERSLARLSAAAAEPRRRLLEARAEQEEKELASCITQGGSVKEGEQVGRTSGDKDWRDQRGELGSTAEARERAIACSDSGVGGGGAQPVPGSWWNSAENASFVDGVLSADLRCCDGSMRRCSVRVEPGAAYDNTDGAFERSGCSADNVPGSWLGSAENARLVNGILSADLRCCDGSTRRCSVEVEPGASYANIDGSFRREGAPAPAAAPPAAPPAAPGAPPALSKEEMQALVKAAFQKLVASGVPPNEAAVQAMQQVKDRKFQPPPRDA
ncbi:unnamed protein product [Prorocentrum cordatum]|uniref:Peptide-N(4)-(N-acetyl-beta-glucosaminyl)asparagine amidase n=1 Tax=Prorocentrum cordatum TaxID=2364126 RepID=A0ABN9VZC1_9DINO|nr:unnamed protein product [Polarella glacialis]